LTLATPVLPPPESAQANAGRLLPGAVGGVTGGCEYLGPEAAELAAGEVVWLAAGFPGGPTWTHPAASSRQSPAAAVSRTGE